MNKGFRLIGFVEAISFVALLGVAMPMKYFLHHPHATRVPGMIHGILFLAYIGLAHALSDREKWPQKKLMHAYLASVLPLGTLIFDRKYLGTAQIS
ncbi:MAG: DUF3817 domain-containing protein [Methylotenera sp.]|nr:DUF3817 domain-containing protein [Oligoflexia bacterium]